MIDPVEALLRTSSLLIPLPTSTSHGHSHVSPLPTVIPTSSPIVQQAGAIGHRTLWIVFVGMLLSSCAFYFMAFRVPVQKRLFHILTAFITTFATISYFAMATGDGVSTVQIMVKESHKHVPDTYQPIERSVYWARYVDWSVTTPLLLMDLCFLAGLSGANILVAVVADIIMILTGLFAAFGTDERVKWGYYAMSCAALLVIIYQLAVHGRAMAMAKDAKTGNFFQAIAGFTLVLWVMYPIVWGIADGSRNISVNAEIVCYAVLDVLAKPVFGFWLLFTHDSQPSSQVNLDGFWSHGLGKEGSIRVGDDDEGA